MLLVVFTTGLALGAIATSLVLWVFSGVFSIVPDVAAEVVLAGFIAALVLRELGVAHFWLPEVRRQVPQSVLYGSGVLPALRFGIELGTGALTYSSAKAPYMLAAAVVLLGPPSELVAAAAIGFAIGRAAMPTRRLVSADVDESDRVLGRRSHALVATSAVTTVVLIAGVLWTAS